MSKESQNTEWKETWRDEYLKWICGFANAQGGKIYIGIDDNGVVSGIANAKKLMEDLPNKVRDILGILVDVNLHQKDGKDYLEIKVESYPYPISYRGEYHYRTGSTKQELKGAALDRFLLQKQGKRWDGVPVPNVAIKDLSKSSLRDFRNRGTKSKRIDKEVSSESDKLLLLNLRLTDGAYLKRAAVLLFHPDPEKYVTGAFVKIGFFKSDADLLFQDEIHGDLFEQVEKTMDLLLTKYLTANISYQGIHRLEKYPYPEAALREALLNAVAHKDYSSGNPIQISVYVNKIIFWNSGELPDDWTVAKLKVKHPSVPFNPDIAATFFKAGFIEAWGRGTIKMLNECKQANLPAPVFTYESIGITVEFSNPKLKFSGETGSEKSRRKVGESSEMIIEAIRNNREITIAELAELIGISPRAIQKQMDKLKKEKKIRRIGADKGGYWEAIE